jgi:hypothetical protein
MAVGWMASVSEGTVAFFFSVAVSMGRKAINGTHEPECLFLRPNINNLGFNLLAPEFYI